MTTALRQLSVNPSEETITAGSLSLRFLITGDDTGGSTAVFEMTVPHGVRTPSAPHSHDGFEETIYGLSGTLTWFINGQQIGVGPGQALSIRRGDPHYFVNLDLQDAKVLCILSPAGIGPAYFREVAAALTAAAGGPPDRARMTEIMLRHGLTPVPLNP